MQISNHITTIEKYTKILSDYSNIEKKIHLLKGTLSISLLLILSICFCNLYTTLSSSIQGIPSILHTLVLSSNALTGVIIIFSLTIVSDRIPEYMSDIRTLAGFLIDAYPYHNFNDLEEVVILKKIKKKKVIYLSAGGVVYIKRSFLLSAFGTLFTYGLLVVNLKKNTD
ncbi:uncharacterized protein NPIL_576601 [Nephila pilipes]|uniref:Gustatory receptor n=1 Tax=Nephila pilipes TaxID=299642 RepID=A0A8X6T628_NEPPI|nr:uncharacterized protein NPIL_576601 [Nephila pilipes]